MARRRAATRQRIFAEAMRLFVERGFDRVTVAEIAEAADIGKGTFFTYFPSKADVFRYLGEQVTLAGLAAMAEVPSDAPAAERIRVLFGAMGRWHEEHPEFARQMAKVRSFTPAADFGSENQRRLCGAIAQAVEEGQVGGQFRAGVSAEDVALALQFQYLGLVATWALHQEGRGLGERLQAAVEIVLRGLA